MRKGLPPSHVRPEPVEGFIAKSLISFIAPVLRQAQRERIVGLLEAPKNLTAYSMRLSSHFCLKNRMDSAMSLPVQAINAKAQRTRRIAKTSFLRVPSCPSRLRVHHSKRYRLTAYSMRLTSHFCLKNRMDSSMSLPVHAMNAKAQRTQRIARTSFLRVPLRPSRLSVHHSKRCQLTAYSMRLTSHLCLKNRMDSALSPS